MARKKRRDKHSRIVDNLADILEEYDYSEKELEYYRRNDSVAGDIDYLGYCRADLRVDLYEVKCTHSPKAYAKAKKQLFRHVNVYMKQSFHVPWKYVNLYYVHGIKGTIEPSIYKVIRIKNKKYHMLSDAFKGDS